MHNNKILNAIFNILLIFLLSTSINAKPLYIEITGGQNTGIPIAVLPFEVVRAKNPIDNMVEVEDISAIVRADLHNSGHFRALDIEGEAKAPKDLAAVNTGYWKNSGAATLVFGKIVNNGNGNYDVSFQLVDVLKDSPVSLLNLRFRNKSPEQFRALAHYISDQIFKKITGVRGFFSTRIAYITVERSSNKTIHTLTVADADGHNDKALVSVPYPLMSPNWSPDGSRIAFVSFRGHRASINVVTVANGEVELISQFPGINSAPAWSPDGRKMALVLSKDGSPKIYVIDLQTRELQRITTGGSIDTEPCWAPDGSSIVFTSNRGGKPQIYRTNLQSGEIQRLTFDGDYNASPSLTPDGKSLIMLHQSQKGAYNIAVQDLNTGKVKLITSASLDESPALAPNGMMVLYGTRDADQHILGAVTLDGKFRMRLPIQDGNVKEPSWSPFLLEDLQ